MSASPRDGQGRISLTWWLTLTILLVAGIISLAEILLFGAYDASTYERYREAKNKVLAQVIAANSTSAIQFRDREDANELLSSLKTEPAIRAAYLFDQDGGPLAQYLRPGEILSVPLITPEKLGVISTEDSYEFWQPVMMGDKRIGTLYLLSDLSESRKRSEERWYLGVYVAMGSIVVALVLAYAFQRVFTGPILSMTSTLARITKNKDFSIRVQQFPQREFAILVDGLNYMLSEIEQRDKAIAAHVELLTKSNKELDQFVYVASHDLKAPLRAVDNLARLIAKATHGLLPPEKADLTELMHSRIKRMETLFDDLLAYSRIGRVELKSENIQVGALLHDIIDLLGPPSSFTIVVQEPMPTLTTMKIPLQQVFRNLVGNALKHHDRPDGRIVISSRDAGDMYEFSICDDGPGIAPQYHEKIFQMFQTLKPRDEVEGSGMGLAIVKKIIESQGGRIWVVSDVGKGTCFSFTWRKVGRDLETNKEQRAASTTL